MLTTAVLFGGATRPGFLGDTIVQLVALPLALVAAALTWRRSKDHAWILGWSAALVALVLIQLLPLPPSIWSRLPLAELIQSVHAQAGIADGWRPLSVSPHDTWISLLSFIAPAAIFFTVLHLSGEQKARLLSLVLVLAVTSCVIGLWQVATASSDPGASPRPNMGYPTGMFLNRNHYSALLYVALLLAAAFMIDGWRDAISRSKMLGNLSILVVPVLSLIVIGTALALIVLARSRAGMVLAVAAMVAAVFIARIADDRKLRQGALRWMISAAVVAFIIVSQHAFTRVISRFAEDALQDGRTTIAQTAWGAAWSLMPFGTGLGTFVPVYKTIEEPSTALMGVYVNHAHNDLIEVWMEVGIPGLILVLIALAWVASRVRFIWWSDAAAWDAQGRLLSAASGAAVVLLLAHSLVDYPLRTAALGAVFALCCGILARPIGFRANAAVESETGRPRSAPTATPPNPEIEISAKIDFRNFPMSPNLLPANWKIDSQDHAKRETHAVPSDVANSFDDAIASTSPGPQSPKVDLLMANENRWPEVWRNSKGDGRDK